MVWCLWYIDAYQDIYKYSFASFITEAPDKIQTVHRIHWEHLVEACGLSLRLGEALNLWIELKRSRSQRGFLGHPSMARVFLQQGVFVLLGGGRCQESLQHSSKHHMVEICWQLFNLKHTSTTHSPPHQSNSATVLSKVGCPQKRRSVF